MIERLRANPIIAGLGLTGLGIGGTALAVQSIFGSQAAVTAPFGVPRLGSAFGPYGILSVFVLAMPFVVFALWVLLRRTRFGLQLAAAGEHPFAARSVGVNPSTMRLIALLGGGLLCAVGGAELSAGSLQIFAQNMTAGRGFMAFAAVVFGAGHPIGSVLRGALLQRRRRGRHTRATGLRRRGAARPAPGAALPGDCLWRLAQRPAARRRQGGGGLRRTA